MKNFRLLFIVVWTFGLFSNQSIAQGTINSNIFSKERRALIHRPHGVCFQDSSTLFNKRIGMGKDFISLPESLQAKDSVYYGLTKGIIYADPKQPLKKANGPMANNAQVYLINTVIEYSTDTNRYSYSYNASGKVTSSLKVVWQNGHWMNSLRDTITYDASGHELTYLRETWQNSQWTNVEFDTTTYDASGHELTDLVETWQNGQLTNDWFTTYTYDASGNELTELEKTWQNGQWMNSYRETNTYDAIGNFLTDLSEIWQNGQWTNSTCDTITYDPSGNIITWLNEYWQNGQWTNDWLETYTYDASGNMLTDSDEAWQNGQLTNAWLYTYTYDASGNIITWLNEYWQNGQWTNSLRDTIICDASGRVLTELEATWHNGQWTDSLLFTYAYDANENITSFSSVTWQNSTWVPSNGFVVISDGPQLEGYVGYRVSITYNLTNITGISAGKPDVPIGYSLSQNYPNPFNPSTVISYQIASAGKVSLKVYDLLGREVATLVNSVKAAGNYKATFNAMNLPSGVYFYRLQTATYSNTKKLLLLK